MRRSISASPVETIWTTQAWPAARSTSTEAISVGVFIAVIRWLKKRCLDDSKAERAADLAWAFSVFDPPSAPVPVTPVASSATSRFEWMT